MLIESMFWRGRRHRTIGLEPERVRPLKDKKKKYSRNYAEFLEERRGRMVFVAFCDTSNNTYYYRKEIHLQGLEE